MRRHLVIALMAIGLLSTPALPQATDQRFSLSSELTFVDGKGAPARIGDYPGQWLLIYFGYTHCADLCPLGLTVMAEGLDMIGAPAKRIQPLFVTVDPEHDKGEMLTTFAREFHPRLIGLTGSDQQIRAAADAMGVKYQKVDRPDGDYSVDHSSSYSLIDPSRKTILTFRRSEPHLVARRIVEALKEAAEPLDGVNGALR